MKTIIFLTFLISSQLFSQWQEDFRLTTNSSDSRTSFNNAWCITASGVNLHAVWDDYRDGNAEIYTKRSTNGGLSWEADTRLTNSPFDSRYASVSISGSVVHVVWHDNRDGNLEIYYKRSTNGGVSWEADTRLTNSSNDSEYPSLSVSGSFVHVVWHQLSTNYSVEIYYKRSTDAGVSWGAETRLTYSPNSTIQRNASVAVSGSLVHVVWDGNSANNNEIYTKRSTNGGFSWGADTRLTNNTATSVRPSVSISGSAVHVVWQDNRDGNDEIYTKRSTDGGINWGTDTRLTNNPAISEYSSVSVSGSVVHAVWDDSRIGTGAGRDIYYKRSLDGGVNWGADTRLTNHLSTERPSIAVSGTSVHVVWYDSRNVNLDIYYKRDPTGNPALTFQSVFNRNNVNKPITDNGNTIDTIDVNITSFTNYTVYDVNLMIDTVLHTNDSDLEFYLLHNGITDTVIYQIGGSGDNFIGTILNDSATNLISGGTAPFTGSFKPHKLLSQFNNDDINGIWILKIYDRASGNSGILHAWSLIITIQNNPNSIQPIGNEIPKGYSLSQNYPNPFNPITNINFAVPKASFVELTVFDILGREVETLVSEYLNAGSYKAAWDAVNYPSGVYFYKVEAGEFSGVKKMIVVK